MSDDKTVVEETNANPAEVEKRTDDVADLDTLLAQFDEGTKQPAVSPPEPVTTDISKFKDQVKAEIIAEQQTASAVKNLVKSIRGEVPEDVLTDDEIQDWLEGQAKRNDQLRTAWMMRDKKPGDWKKIESGLSNRLNSKFGKSRIDPDATADREAVAQAVRGNSTKVAAEPPPDLSKMSNAELRKYTQDNWGFSI